MRYVIVPTVSLYSLTDSRRHYHQLLRLCICVVNISHVFEFSTTSPFRRRHKKMESSEILLLIGYSVPIVTENCYIKRQKQGSSRSFISSPSSRHGLTLSKSLVKANCVAYYSCLESEPLKFVRYHQENIRVPLH